MFNKDLCKIIGQIDQINGLDKVVIYSETMRHLVQSLDVDERKSCYSAWDEGWSCANEKGFNQYKYAILQLSEDDSNHFRRFSNYETLKKLRNELPDVNNYELVFLRNVSDDTLLCKRYLNNIYRDFSSDGPRPSDYYGHSLSVSDVIVFAYDDLNYKAYFVDSIGFIELDNFLNKRMISRINNDLTIKNEFSLLKDIISFHNDNRILLNTDISQRYTEIDNEYFFIFELAEERRKNEFIYQQSIVIEGHRGSWHVVSSEMINGQTLFLLEHNIYGDEAASLIVDIDKNILLDDVWNGFDDYREYISNEEEVNQKQNETPVNTVNRQRRACR